MNSPADISADIEVTTRGSAGGLMRIPARALLAIIGLYQRIVSPLLPIVTAGACACRFAPTCSHYAAEAIRLHGAVRGSWLALRRLVKCTPLHPGGVDPVPAALPSRRRADPAAYACFSVTRDSPDTLGRSSSGPVVP